MARRVGVKREGSGLSVQAPISQKKLKKTGFVGSGDEDTGEAVGLGPFSNTRDARKKKNHYGLLIKEVI